MPYNKDYFNIFYEQLKEEYQYIEISPKINDYQRKIEQLIENNETKISDFENLIKLIIEEKYFDKYCDFNSNLLDIKENYESSISNDSKLSSIIKTKQIQQIQKFCEDENSKFNKFIFSFHILKMCCDLKKNIAVQSTNAEKQSEILKDTEHNILTHVLTLLGVFTTIITIIITTISTTASWLNNSNNSSFMVALLLPASIILLSTFLLLFMIKLLFLYKRNISKEETNKFLCRKNVILILIFVGIMVLFGSSIGIAISKDKEPKHSEPIIIEDYVINQEENKLTYTYNEVKFTIELNYDLIHEDGLHYCTIHNKFE